MSTQTKTATGTKGKTKDVITQIKKDTEGPKDTKVQEHDEIEWERHESEEEDDTQKKKGVVIEQGKVGNDKPKKLRDLFSDDAPKKVAPAKKSDKVEG
jgi:hypothetical protein